MRAPVLATIAAAGAAALALGGVALGAALAVPNEPEPAYISHYLEQLEAVPPPPASAAILAGATDQPVPGAPDDADEPEPDEADEVDVPDEVDEPDEVEDNSGRGSDNSGSGSSNSGRGGGDD